MEILYLIQAFDLSGGGWTLQPYCDTEFETSSLLTLPRHWVKPATLSHKSIPLYINTTNLSKINQFQIQHRPTKRTDELSIKSHVLKLTFTCKTFPTIKLHAPEIRHALTFSSSLRIHITVSPRKHREPTTKNIKLDSDDHESVIMGVTSAIPTYPVVHCINQRFSLGEWYGHFHGWRDCVIGISRSGLLFVCQRKPTGIYVLLGSAPTRSGTRGQGCRCGCSYPSP